MDRNLPEELSCTALPCQAAKRYSDAFQQFTQAASKGYGSAMNNFVWMYDNGTGVPKSDADAVAWYRKAAEAGNADGMYNLGVMLRHGWGVA
jgi:uncharacterized protein